MTQFDALSNLLIGGTTQVLSNQAWRLATVLAVTTKDGLNELLVEYEMPAGSTALVTRLLHADGQTISDRPVSYGALPVRWVRYLQAAPPAELLPWAGRGQTRGSTIRCTGKRKDAMIDFHVRKAHEKGLHAYEALDGCSVWVGKPWPWPFATAPV